MPTWPVYHGNHPRYQMPSFVRLGHRRVEPSLLVKHIALLELAEIVYLTVQNDEENVANLERVVLVPSVSGHFEAILVIRAMIADDGHIPARDELISD